MKRHYIFAKEKQKARELVNSCVSRIFKGSQSLNCFSLLPGEEGLLNPQGNELFLLQNYNTRLELHETSPAVRKAIQRQVKQLPTEWRGRISIHGNNILSVRQSLDQTGGGWFDLISGPTSENLRDLERLFSLNTFHWRCVVAITFCTNLARHGENYAMKEGEVMGHLLGVARLAGYSPTKNQCKPVSYKAKHYQVLTFTMCFK